MLKNNIKLKNIISTDTYHKKFWDELRNLTVASSNLPKEAKIYLYNSFVLPISSINLLKSKVKEISKFRNVATVIEADQSEKNLIYYDSPSHTIWVDDMGYPLDNDMQPEASTDKNIIKSHKLASLVRIGNSLKYDKSFPLEKFLINKISKEFVENENTAFISGDGVKTPTGILDENQGAKVGHSTTSLTFDDIIKLYTNLDSKYRDNAVWIMNDNTALYLKTLKDTSGRYIWDTEATTLLGKQVIIMNSMPDIGIGKYPIAFGDFSHYWIVERAVPTVRILSETYAMRDITGYLAYQTLDGFLKDREAVKLLQIL